VASDTDKTGLTVKASPELKEVNLWICDSPDRDFRDNQFVEKDVEYVNYGSINVKVEHPDKGFRAFYLELIYPDPVEGTYSKSTRMFVADDDELFLN
jgi:PhoPQ-activated pathogenicity-related protein